MSLRSGERGQTSGGGIMASWKRTVSSWPVLLLVYCCLASTSYYCSAYSAFDCKGIPAWKLNASDNTVMMARFQNMLTVYQNHCTNRSTDYWTTTNYGGGIGAGIMISIVNYMKAFEMGKIYRPTSTWLWSSSNPAVLCYNHIGSVDCFNEPLSYCWYKPNTQYSVIMPNSLKMNITDAYDLIKKPSDICSLAKFSKKSILWVMGQLLHYHMRLPSHLHKQVHKRMETIFPKNVASEIDPVTGMKCLTASIHVRGGTPDFSRKPFDGTDHVKALEDMNKRLNPKNSTICKVYVSGDHLEDTIFVPPQLKNKNVGNYSQAFTVRNGSFVFMSLPRYIAAPGELEHQAFYIKFHGGNITTMEYIYSEYVEDLLLHADADVFIGSHSNMFSAVAALRQAYHPNWKSDRTCFLDSRQKPPPLGCMNSGQVYQFFRDAYSGFNGGAIFFP